MKLAIGPCLAVSLVLIIALVAIYKLNSSEEEQQSGTRLVENDLKPMYL